MTHKDILDRRRPIIESCSDWFKKLCRWMPEFLTEELRSIDPKSSHQVSPFSHNGKLFNWKFEKSGCRAFDSIERRPNRQVNDEHFGFHMVKVATKAIILNYQWATFLGSSAIHWLSSSRLKNSHWRWYSGAPRFEPGQLVQMRECYLSAMPSPIMPTRLIETFVTIGSIWNIIDITNQLH